MSIPAKVGCAREAARAERRVGLRAAVHSVDAEEQDRRAREVEVVDRVTVGNVERSERLDDAVAAARDVVQVDDVDAEGRAEAADEIGPRLALLAHELERAHRAVRLVRLDLPARADRDREVVPIVVSRRVDQCARVVLGAAAVAVDHVQHTVRRRRREGIVGHALEG